VAEEMGCDKQQVMAIMAFKVRRWNEGWSRIFGMVLGVIPWSKKLKGMAWTLKSVKDFDIKRS